MAYRRTDNVVRKQAARHAAILAAARALAAERGMAAVQIAPVAERAAIAAGTVYRYFPAKTELVTALVEALAAQELAAIAQAADRAPGPLSALAAAVATFAARAMGKRRLVFALIAEPVEPELDAARVAYRSALAAEFARRIRAAQAHLPEQDVAVAAPALVGALIEGLIGPLAAGAADEPAKSLPAKSPTASAVKSRAAVQAATLFALRALGVADARARGLVVQTVLPSAEDAG